MAGNTQCVTKLQSHHLEKGDGLWFNEMKNWGLFYILVLTVDS